MIEERTIDPPNFIKVDIMYPRNSTLYEHGESTSGPSAEGYEARGEQYGSAQNEKHCFYYVKDMTPDEVLVVKCFDSRSRLMDKGSTIAHGSGHTAFVDPPKRHQMHRRDRACEVRCLVFYESDDDIGGAKK